MDMKKWAADSKAHTESASAADLQVARDAMAKARQYVTDFDKDGKKAEAIYKLLDRAKRLMSNYSDPKSIEMSRDITSILSEKIGPASRATLSGQKNAK